MIHLNITDDEKKEEFLVFKNSIDIGSSPKADLIFIDPEISEICAQLTIKNEMLYIKSFNKKFVHKDGEQISVETQLKNDDLVQIGKNEIKIIAFNSNHPSSLSSEDSRNKKEEIEHEYPELSEVFNFIDKMNKNV